MKNHLSLVLVFSLFFFQVGVFAETAGFNGEITTLDSTSGSFQIAKGDTPEEREKGVNLIVLKDTVYNGIGSLNELRVGDEVAVEAQINDKTKLWEARSVNLVKVKIRDTAL